MLEVKKYDSGFELTLSILDTSIFANGRDPAEAVHNLAKSVITLLFEDYLGDCDNYLGPVEADIQCIRDSLQRAESDGFGVNVHMDTETWHEDVKSIDDLIHALQHGGYIDSIDVVKLSDDKLISATYEFIDGYGIFGESRYGSMTLYINDGESEFEERAPSLFDMEKKLERWLAMRLLKRQQAIV